MDRPGQARRRRPGFLGELRDAVKRGSAGPVSVPPPAGRAERLGLAAPGLAGSQAEALPSRIVHAGHRHKIGAELAGSWHGRPDSILRRLCYGSFHIRPGRQSMEVYLLGEPHP